MRTTYQTGLVGILCHPVGENLIHEIFSAAAEITGADVACLMFDAQAKDIATPVGALHTIAARGVYLTGRLRASALGCVDYLADEAHGTGIINAITIEGDQTTGHNTEASAIVQALEPYKDMFTNGGAVIMGGGAMARAAAYAVIRHFRVKHVALADRTVQQAQLMKQFFGDMKLASRIEAHELFPPDIAQLLAESRLIINATSVGAFPTVNETPVTIPDVFHNRQLVLDVNYNPAFTRMLADAADAGATTISGIEILMTQVGAAFELLCGVPFPAEEIRRLLVTNEEEAG